MIRQINCTKTEEPVANFRLSRLCIRLKYLFFPLVTALITTQSFAAINKSSTFVELSIEELGNVQITSVSKNEERLADAAAAIYVITGEAINRSGANTLPEALRLAPNLEVAQINANQYAISARGFNSNTANKLLVLIDGRAVYTPLYSGVFWDAQDVMMQDIDRIEVISGPGGTLWGTNAVNGVINIITKKSSETEGNLVSVIGGSTGGGLAMRHGGEFNDNNGAYRVYAKFDDWQHTISTNAPSTPEGWGRGQIGFRTDWRNHDSDYTIQGDAYKGKSDLTTGPQQDYSGENLLARWNQRMDDGSTLRVQGYFDRTTRDYPGIFSEKLNTFDLDIQYSLEEKEGSRLTFGGGYRISDDNVVNSTQLAFLPPQIYLHWANLFVQQEQALSQNWRLTLGAKVEKNDYTGVEFLPSLKLAWKFSENKLIWGDLSRSVRTPSRLDVQFFSPATPPYILAGGPNFRSEIADTLDLGLRGQDGDKLSYTIVAFHSRYDKLRSLDRESGAYELDNDINGSVSGLETWARYQLNNAWSFDAGVQYLNEKFSGPNLALSLPGNDPRWQFKLGAKWNINSTQHVDVALRHITELPSPAVPAYTAVDATYGWQLSKNIEIMVIGRNLFDAHHEEFPSSSRGVMPALIKRTLNVALTARF